MLVLKRAAALAAAAAALPAAAAAHGPDGYVLPEGAWRAWTWDPWVLGGVLLSAWLYSRGVERLWRRAGTGRGVRRWQAACFAAGTLVLVLALVSPVHALGGALFSAHMAQHVLLMVVAAPLLVAGAPLVAFVWALPAAWRTRVGGWASRPAVRGTWRAVSTPPAAWTLHAAALWVWHVPALYQATLTSEAVHLVQHVAFIGTALLFWEAVHARAARRRAAFGGVLYVFTTAVHSGILGALLTFSLVVWYPAYAVSAGAWGLTPLEDQQLGGLVMWVPAGVVYLAAVLALLGIALSDPVRAPRPVTAGMGRTGAAVAVPRTQGG